ncbi:hypothetical protein LINPERHAP1_LOCUS34747, partial [Linum perenne]
ADAVLVRTLTIIPSSAPKQPLKYFQFLWVQSSGTGVGFASN